jgi:hypothetical protein
VQSTIPVAQKMLLTEVPGYSDSCIKRNLASISIIRQKQILIGSNTNGIYILQQLLRAENRFEAKKYREHLLS